VPNFASDILVNVVRTKIPLISISLSSLALIFVLVLVSSTIIQNVFVIFVIVFVVVDEKNTVWYLERNKIISPTQVTAKVESPQTS